MRKWIMIVETLLNEKAIAPLTARFLHSITADTEENRKHLRDLERYAKQIEAEEQEILKVPHSVKAVPHVDNTEEWDSYWQAQELEWAQFEKEHKLRKQKEAKQQADAYSAQVDGIRLAAKDAMDDMIEKDREVVSKLAKQALKSQQQQNKKIRKQAMRQLKQ